MGGFCKVSPIIGMEHPYFYRNKVHAVFDHDRKGNVISGIYAEGTHRVIAVEESKIRKVRRSSVQSVNFFRLLRLRHIMKIQDMDF